MMRNTVLLLLTALLFLLVTGCAVGEEAEAVASTSERPDKVLEDIWIVQEKNTEIEIISEKTVLKASGLLKYQGENVARDVSIAIKSPLTSAFLGDDPVQYYGTVSPGDDLVYTLDCSHLGFRKKVPLGSSDRNLMEDFLHNSYLEVVWKDCGAPHQVQFYNWDDDCQLGL
jgi:hypothetical protein